MSIQKKEYELSIWKEELRDNGNKIETKLYIIGAHDMSYPGRATALNLTKKINGTQVLTFQMPDKYFDSEKGKYIKNQFIDELFVERKVKLKFDNQWYEFFIKKISESKKHKSYIKTYTCTDAFIDELSRNGYGITFHEDLHNNVEEIGSFAETILEDSLWHYNSVYNWGDFTEVLEEKLFKIPISCFGGAISAYKLHYDLELFEEDNSKIINAFTQESRALEMGDDLARGKYYWDQRNSTFLNQIQKDFIENIPNDGYIYVPYSCLDFCYGGEEPDDDKPIPYDRAATEVAQKYPDNNINSLAISPASVDPRTIIQFLIIPDKEKIEIDEAGVIVSKDYTYFLPLQKWNQAIKSNYWYYFEDTRLVDAEVLGSSDLASATMSHTYRYIKDEGTNQIIGTYKEALGNKILYYEGYLSNIKDNNIIKGKKVQISNRTEINISEEIDQYVTIYQEGPNTFENLFLNSENWIYNKNKDNKYYVCSKTDTRQVVPQLARNYIQNGTNIKSTDGWEMMSTNSFDYTILPSLDIRYDYINNEQNIPTINNSYLYYNHGDEGINYEDKYKAFINFGMIGQEKKIKKGKIYCFGINAAIQGSSIHFKVKIGNGSLDSNGNYLIEDDCISFNTSDNLCWSGQAWEELKDSKYEYIGQIPTKEFYLLFKSEIEIETPYISLQLSNNSSDCLIKEVYLFEAFTRGRDQFKNADIYRYSGRTLFGKEVWDKDGERWTSGSWDIQENYSYTSIQKKSSSQLSEKDIAKKLIIFEDDIMTGATYTYQKYFIQRIEFIGKDGNKKYYDTMGAKSFLDTQNININGLPQDAAKYTEDNYQIQTNYIDLNQCEFYNPQASYKNCDCSFNNSTHTCYYQKFGYCPYRFTPEKHCRKVRTLKGEKSNRFNLIQELSKVFKCYPIFNIEHKDNGTVITNNNIPAKQLFFITEKGMENKLGFRYEKNLSNITREIDSDKIVTKLYVNDVDSEISKTGLCSIKTAEDNPTKDSFIIDFSYYLKKGILDEQKVEEDLWGISNQNNTVCQGYLKQLGYYNTEYDKLSNKIINLQDASYNELKANLNVNLEGIDTSLQQIQKILKRMNSYISIGDLDSNKAYQNQKIKLSEQRGILKQLIESTFFTDGVAAQQIELYYGKVSEAQLADDILNNPMKWFELIETNYSFLKQKWTEDYTYTEGILGQFNTEYKQIQRWKKERASYLKEINNISTKFFKKYEPYLKEGTWSDSNFISDNAYYLTALDVAAEGAIPKVSYNISVIDLAALKEYAQDYTFNIADTTYVEDIGMFGFNKRTGLPNKLKVLISEISYNLDEPTKNSIKVQDFTTQFEDLFQQVIASIQSLTYNENIYKRSSNFTSLHNIEKDSLQGTLNTNDLILLNTDENNIKVDNSGTSGSDINNHANKYKLNGQGLFFSNDGGVHWNVGVGPNGINADYIKVGTLDAGKIRIADSSYIYFAWDKDGIYAYRDPSSGGSSSDYVLYNRNGLSVIEAGNIRLRAGYSLNQNPEKQGDNVGFYLYDKDGNVIFSTEPVGDNSARLSLAGEIFTTNNTSWSSTDYNYKYQIKLKKTNSIIYQLALTMNSFSVTSQPVQIYYQLNESNLYYIANGYRKVNGGNGFKIGSNYYEIKSSSEKDIFSIEDSSVEIETPTYVDSNSILMLNNNSLISTYGYKINNIYYLNRRSIPVPGQLKEGSVEVYLNNQYKDVNDKYRVFSIMLKQSDNDNWIFNNIFTVLKNGDLYLGGTSNTSDKDIKVPDIKNAKLSYINGSLYIDFNNIRNINDNAQSLSSFVKQEISGAIDGIGEHYHYIPSDQLHGDWAVNSNNLDDDLSTMQEVFDTVLQSSTPIETLKTLIRNLNDFLYHYNIGDWKILLDNRTEESEV